MLRGRRVLLAVTGGVAAYKSAYLARRLVERGADPTAAAESKRCFGSLTRQRRSSVRTVAGVVSGSSVQSGSRSKARARISDEDPAANG